MKLASQRDAAKQSTAVDTTTALWTVDVTIVPLATARNPTTATDAICRATSSAFMALSAALQLVHCATCDQYLDGHQELSITIRSSDCIVEFSARWCFLSHLPLHELILGRGWWQLIDLWGCPANLILAEFSEPVSKCDHHAVRRGGHIASFLPIIEAYRGKFALLQKEFNRQELYKPE